MDTTGQHHSPWAGAALPECAPLAADAQADVCVVGAGIAGMTTAYLLARKGKRVIVIDDGPVGGGMTSATTAHLMTAIDDRYYEIERLHGAEGARLAATSHRAAVEAIEAIVAQEAIACDFARLDGYLFLPPGGDPAELEAEYQAARRAGIDDVAWAERAPLDGIDTGRCLRFPRQGQFHPLKYLAGLARAIVREGGRIHGGVHAEAIEGGARPCVRARGGLRIACDDVVVATNAPISDRFAIHTKQAPYTTYAIALRVPRGSVATALYWDTLDDYHYVRLDAPDGELLIVGGEDHKSGQADDGAARFDRLELWARARFPSAREVLHRWSGQVMETVDGLAFIGADPGDPHVWVATGDSGMGMTHGTIAGILLTDLIHGAEVAWAKLYDPGRFRARAAGAYLKENANVAAQYADWAKPAEAGTLDDIAPGSGAVIRRGVHRIAAYRDPDGALHQMSAACTHLGCLVSWNSHERTWDCPCHGSRFDCRGEVINGPATAALAPWEESSAPRVRNSRQEDSSRPTPGL